MLAILLTADDETLTAIPEAGYAFAVLKRAQALGDAEALAAHDRRIVRIHLRRGARDVAALTDVFKEALT